MAVEAEDHLYFWEDRPAGALQWTGEVQDRTAPVGNPAVLGAIIDTGHCLNLTDPKNASLVTSAYTDCVELCQKTGLHPLENKGPESKARFLDCSVMNLLHELREKEGHRPFDTVRGFFLLQPRFQILLSALLAAALDVLHGDHARSKEQTTRALVVEPDSTSPASLIPHGTVTFSRMKSWGLPLMGC